MTEPGYTYIKIEPQNFSETVYDTSDLSTIRGSSLILAEAPQAIISMIDANPDFSKFQRTLIASSASMLFMRLYLLSPSGAPALPEPDSKLEKPNGVEKKPYRKALNEVTGGIGTSPSEASILKAAADLRDQLKLDQTAISDVKLTSQILWALGTKKILPPSSEESLPLKAQVRDVLVSSIRALLSDQSGDTPFWQFKFGVAAVEAALDTPIPEVSRTLDT